MTALALFSHVLPMIKSYDRDSLTYASTLMVKFPNRIGMSLTTPNGCTFTPSAIMKLILVGSLIPHPSRSRNMAEMMHDPAPESMTTLACLPSTWHVAYMDVLSSSSSWAERISLISNPGCCSLNPSFNCLLAVGQICANCAHVTTTCSFSSASQALKLYVLDFLSRCSLLPSDRGASFMVESVLSPVSDGWVTFSVWFGVGNCFP